MPALRFPLDESKSKARVSFQVMELQTVNVILDTFRTFAEEAGVDAESLDRQARRGLRRIGIPAEDRKKMEEERRAYIGERFESLYGTGQAVTRLEPKIILYLPQSLEISDGVELDAFDLGPLGAIAQKNINEGGNAQLVSTVTKGMVELINAAVSPIKTIQSEAGRVAINETLAHLPIGETLKGLAGTQLRASINPNARNAFQSVPLREFSFSFTLIPSSPEEVEITKQIIKFFRTHLYPRAISVADSPRPFWAYPNVWEINQYYGTEENRLATRFLPAYLSSFSATYNNESQAYFEGGDFTDTSINMTFVETSTLTSQQISEDGY